MRQIFQPDQRSARSFPSHLIDQLRELAEAEPFKRFAINMRSGKSYLVNRRADIGFTDHGNPRCEPVASGACFPASSRARAPFTITFVPGKMRARPMKIEWARQL